MTSYLPALSRIILRWQLSIALLRLVNNYRAVDACSSYLQLRNQDMEELEFLRVSLTSLAQVSCTSFLCTELYQIIVEDLNSNPGCIC
jgi:hypothetical protein